MKKILVLAFALATSLSLSAQDLTALYNEAANAYTTKNFPVAIEKFQALIEQGAGSDEAANMIVTAQSALPKCYFMLGGAAVQQGLYDQALENFNRSVALAQEFGDLAQAQKSQAWVGRVYQAMGGDAYNNKDYTTAAEIFAKGYEADPRNTEMALNLAMSYCEMAMADGNMDQYAKGMDIYAKVAEMTAPRYVDDAAKAKEMMTLYIQNMIAKLQSAGNTEGVLAMAESMLAKDAAHPVLQKVRVQAYADRKDYGKVIELAEAAAAMQTAAEDKSLIYYQLGAAYNAREMKPQAIEAFRKVTEGPAVEPAKQALTELSK